MEGKQPDARPRRVATAQARVARLPFGLRGLGWAVGDWLADARTGIAAAVERELDRRTPFNLLPAAFGLGILAWFVADRLPLWWGPPLALFVFAGLALVARSTLWPRLLLISLAAASAGLWAADLRAKRVDAPVLPRTTIAPLTGFVESVESRDAGGMRAVLRVTSFAALGATEMPRRVRVTLRTQALGAGEHIRVTARLTPPPEPARPGGYDFARDAWFRGLGAVGSGLGTIERVAPTMPPDRDLAWRAAIDGARNAATERIASVIGGQAGAVAAALVTGKRGLISEETNEALRAAGLYHIVSISGLHMALAAGAIFWLVRALLALSATAALQWPVKKIAAGTAMAGASAYCLFSGAEVATVRSLIMTLVMLGAILADRPALSMRNLAIAALIVLALEPDSLLGPSFQMSFGAVAALIAFAEWQRRRPKRVEPKAGWLGRAGRALRLAFVALALTTVLASMATGPFGAYHFQTFNPFGLIGNLMALPFVSLVVMPAAVVGVLLYPLGLDALAWTLMGLATQPVLWVSHLVAGWEGSTVVIPAFGARALILLAGALILATLLTTWLRLIAAIPFAIGISLAATPERADIFIDREGAGVAARASDGRLAVMGRPSAFVLEQWLRADGDGRKPDDPTLRAAASCDVGGCMIRLPDGRALSWSQSPETISEDCRRAELVITPRLWRGSCAALMVDRATLDSRGAMSIHSEPDGLRAETVRGPGSRRPWHPTPRTAPQPATMTTEPPEERFSIDAAD